MLDRDASSLNECCALLNNNTTTTAAAAATTTTSSRIKDGRVVVVGMAPSPDNDTAPKAPDKPRHGAAPKEKNKDDKTLSDLNDGELKGLLDEALNYKNPKDREGKSKLFNNLLNAAEEVERNDRAYRAGGSELVRYYNSSAAKRGSRHRKKPSSVSENMMHGGSLDNLAKEELYETSKHRTKKSVSARQREGGSLPCNVNAASTAITTHVDYQFLEEARKKKEMTNEKKSSNDVEAQSLLEHDTLAQTFQEQIEISHYQPLQCKYTTKASFQVSGSGEVDGAIQIPYLEQSNERKSCTGSKSGSGQGVGGGAGDCAGSLRVVADGKKVDENGNALHQNLIKTKKKKVLTDKNVVVCNAENVKGHRSDIINDMDKLMEFIGITDDHHHHHQSNGGRSIKSSKQLNRHCSDDNNAIGGVVNNNNNNNKSSLSSTSSSSSSSSKKQRAHSSKSKENRSKLKKSNSLGEISTTNLDADFEFDKDKVVMRNNNNDDDDDDEDNSSNNNNNNNKVVMDKPRERRSWGNMEPPSFHHHHHHSHHQILYSNASAENLETAEFRVVTKKKKSKKRRNSISGRATAPKTSTTAPGGRSATRAPSPDPRRKSACSVPHSEKSNDSSDVDSVHSLPIDTQRLDMAADRATRCLNMPISYADMAKQQERQPKEKKMPKDQQQQQQQQLVNDYGRCVSSMNQVVSTMCATEQQQQYINKNNSVESGGVNNNNNNKNNTPPDVHNIKNFPAITKQVAVQVNVVDHYNRIPTTTTATTTTMIMKNSNVAAAAGGGINNYSKVGGGRNQTAAGNKNVKNNVNKTVVCVMMDNHHHQHQHHHHHQNSLQNDCVVATSVPPYDDGGADHLHYSSSLPPDIPDVQTIEKMQLIGQGHPPSNCYDSSNNNNNSPLKNGNSDCNNSTNNNNNSNNNSNNNNPISVVDCDNKSEKRTTNVDVRPPVVILSGYGNSKEVPGLVFGFDINEQLLNEDNNGDDDDDGGGEVEGDGGGGGGNGGYGCEDFVSRYVAPEVYSTTSHNHDKIVNFIGAAWEEAVLNLSNGKVQYYSDLL